MKNAGKACNNRLYRHIRTFEKIIKNYFVIYDKYVKNNCKGGKSMDNTRRIYLDNIRWITVCIVAIYHVIYMYNGVQPFGVIGPFKE